MNCPNCGAGVPAGVTTCPKCGGGIERAATTPPPMPAAPIQVVVQVGSTPTVPAAVPGAPKSKIAAGLLGIFLGWLGVHRFYLGYNGIGVCQLLLTVLTCGYGAILSGIWGLVEGILILFDVINRDASGRPLKN